MNAQQAKPYHFDAGRTGLFPGSCLPHGRHPAYPAAQASLPTPALGCGRGRRHYSGRRSIFDGEGDALRQTRKVPAMKGSPVKSNRPQFSWWLRSVINGDGRRVITLWRSYSVNRNQSRAVNSPRAFRRKAGVKLPVQFARGVVPVVVQLVGRGGRAAAVPGPVGRSLANLPPAMSATRSAPRSPCQRPPGGPGTT